MARGGLIWSVLSAAAVLVPLTVPAHALSLRDAVRHTVETNPEIAAAVAGRKASDYALKQGLGRRLPTVDLSADTGKQKVIRPLSLSDKINDRWRDRELLQLTVPQILFSGWDL